MAEILKVIGSFDGASRGNPGEAGAGALIKDKSGNILWQCADYLGVKTNNEAEYGAVIRLLKAAAEMGVSEIKVQGDSNLVIQQLSRVWKIKEPRLAALASEAWEAARSMKVTYIWVPRDQNKEADALSNEAIDHQYRSKSAENIFNYER